jgi:hypothetical protein
MPAEYLLAVVRRICRAGWNQALWAFTIYFDG